MNTEQTTATIIETPAGEPNAVVVELPPEIIEGEIVSDEGGESDAVAIAQIEADRDITIAAIQAETTQTIVEAETEAREEARTDREEIAWLRDRVENLTGQVETMGAALAVLSTPQVLQEETPPIVMEVEEPETMTISTPQFTQGETSETLMEAISESVEEKPAVNPDQIPRPRVRLI